LLVGGCGWIGIDRRDEHGMTALMRAARAGDLAETERLIARGAGVNAEVPTREFREFIAFISWMQELPKSDIGYTPLLYAVKGGHHAITDLLLRHHANVNHADRLETTALRLATHRSDVALMTMLANAGARPDQRDLRSPSATARRRRCGFCSALAQARTAPCRCRRSSTQGPGLRC
jgi:ankyrin repeat protein